MSVLANTSENSSNVIDGIPFFEWSPIGIAAIAVLLIFTGGLVPRPMHKEVVKDRDYWRELAQTLAEQNRELLVTARVMSGDRTEQR